MSATIALLDYGSGNLRSAYRALLRTGADVTLTSDPQVAAAADGLVVPGVGAYAACMAGLERVGGVQVIRDRVAAGRPVLGICVGHQVLFESGIEHGVASAGVGVLPGVVEQLRTQRLPHMGWNEIEAPADSVLFAGVADQRFYFVHSYAVRAEAAGADTAGITWCTHETDRFVAAVERGPICATQFHPEKSGDAGAVVLANWVSAVQS